MGKTYTVQGRLAHVLGLFLVTVLPGFSQGNTGVLFDKLPQTYQLYARDAQNQAAVPVAGRVSQPGWQYASVRVFRNKNSFAYQRVPVQYAGGTGTFAAVPVLIRAEKASYDFAVYLVKDTDSVLVANPTGVVAGDVYVMAGQSNASAYFSDTRTNEFCRTFGKNSGMFGTDAGNPADTLWALANQTAPDQNVGATGFAFQQYILDKYGIPTCLINAAAHWSMMLHFAQRTANNPADPTNRYGRMLYRLRKSGLDGSVKALIYRQGESEAYGEGNNWGGYFAQFYANLKTDVPSIRQHYVCQIDLIEAGVAAAPKVREAQRALATTYPDVQVLATVGTAGFDGLHYTQEGYSQTGIELARLAGRDFYADTDTDNIDSPNIEKAWFSTAARDELTISVKAGQTLVWPADVEGRQLSDYFYLDGQAGLVRAGRATGNRVVLTLKAPSNATTLTYLPLKGVPYLYTGPYLANKRGMRALSFLNFSLTAPPADVPPPVVEPPVVVVVPPPTPPPPIVVVPPLPPPPPVPVLATPVLTATATYATSVRLSWAAVSGAVRYVLERRADPASAFTPVVTLDAVARNYLDQPVAPGMVYTYRLRAEGATPQQATPSAWAVAEVSTPTLLAAPVLSLTVVYANALRVSWQPVAGATTYELDRKSPAGTYQRLGTFGPAALSLSDTNLLPGQTYTYRIRAVGNLTESPVAEAGATLPALLALPVLRVDPVSFGSIAVSWSVVAGATEYWLERREQDAGTYQAPVRLTAEQTNFTDIGLKANTLYTYRLTAFGDRTNSPTAVVGGTTSMLLSVADPVVEARLWPNPAQGSTTLHLSEPVSGQLRVLGSRGDVLQTQSLSRVNEVPLAVAGYPAGVYLVEVQRQAGQRLVIRLVVR